MDRAPVEMTTRFATTVPTMQAAWVFVMEHLELVGPMPSIEITSVVRVGDGDEDEVVFTVVVRGMVEIGPGGVSD